jgi:hypothetical protein
MHLFWIGCDYFYARLRSGALLAAKGDGEECGSGQRDPCANVAPLHGCCNMLAKQA